MHTMRLDTIAVGFMTIVAAAVFGIVLVHAALYAPEDGLPVPLNTSAAFATSTPGLEPQRMQIPALEVDAKVQSVGLSAKGNIGIPTNFTDVAWYKLGPAPGTAGTAIFDGHVDNGLGLAGVFKHLNDLRAGDDIYVQTANGATEHFVVYNAEAYQYQSVPMQTIMMPRSDAELVLISCEGDWVAGEKTYDHRLVVYAKLVK